MAFSFNQNYLWNLGLFLVVFWEENVIFTVTGREHLTEYILVFIVISGKTCPQKQTNIVETIKQIIPAPPTIGIHILSDWRPIFTSFTILLLDLVSICPIASFIEFLKLPILLVSCFPTLFSLISSVNVLPSSSLFFSSMLLLLFPLWFVVSVLDNDVLTLYLHKNGNFLWHRVSWTDLPDILAQSSICPNC